jgi:mannose-6-phosphate isomerase
MIPENISGLCYDKSYMAKKISFNTDSEDKITLFHEAAEILFDNGLKLIDMDAQRPWGFFLSVDESQAQEFISLFYSRVKLDGVDPSLPLRPKLLGIEPGKRLSWQYHHRRSEIWRTLAGSYDLVTSSNDTELAPKTIGEDEVVYISKGTRHRGVGGKEWALIAEIWQHSDASNPSNEDDIVRVQDDFGR